MSELSGARLPTGEEASKAAGAAKDAALAAAETGKQFMNDMMADLPPTKLADNARMQKYIDELAAEGGAPSGLVGALKPCLLSTIQIFLTIQPWFMFFYKWGSKFWSMVPQNLATMLFGAALCCKRARPLRQQPPHPKLLHRPKSPPSPARLTRVCGVRVASFGRFRRRVLCLYSRDRGLQNDGLRPCT